MPGAKSMPALMKAPSSDECEKRSRTACTKLRSEIPEPSLRRRPERSLEGAQVLKGTAFHASGGVAAGARRLVCDGRVGAVGAKIREAGSPWRVTSTGMV